VFVSGRNVEDAFRPTNIVVLSVAIGVEGVIEEFT